MSNLIFIFKAFNPNKRSTYFMHKEYTSYLANSEYAIKNKDDLLKYFYAKNRLLFIIFPCKNFIKSSVWPFVQHGQLIGAFISIYAGY